MCQGGKVRKQEAGNTRYVIRNTRALIAGVLPRSVLRHPAELNSAFLLTLITEYSIYCA